MRMKKVISILLTTLMLFSSIFGNVSFAAGTPSVSLTLDKTTAEVGDIITATLNVKDATNLSGYQAAVKYDPTVLQPLYDGDPYEAGMAPEAGTILKTKKYNPTELASNDTEKGILNFGKSYMSIASYKTAGNPETTGSLAVITFKVLKNTKTTIKLQNTDSMKDGIDGIMLFDWDGAMIKSFTVSQAQSINGQGEVENTPVVKATEKPSSSAKPTATQAQQVTGSKFYVTLDKNEADVGSLIKATFNISEIANFSGYQISFTYDPTVLKPIYEDGSNYEASTGADAGKLLQTKKYNPTELASNDLENGALSFGRSYMSLASYKAAGTPETTGSVAVVYFEVLKKKATSIKLVNSASMANGKDGTMLFDWDGVLVKNYTVIQPESINGVPTETSVPSTTTSKPTPKPTEKVTSEEPQNTPVAGSNISLTLDKTTASVGDTVKATLKINDVAKFAGYQVGIKYDASVLKPVLSDGSDLEEGTAPDSGDILITKKYNPAELATNDLKAGVLTFGKSYMSIGSYKTAGKAESNGTVAVLYFEVLKNTATRIYFDNVESMKDGYEGTMLFDWDGKNISGYSVVNPESLNGKVVVTQKPSPSPFNPTDYDGIAMSVDKTTASVGDIITATLSMNGLKNFSGYQANVKYDPSVLEPVDYDESTTPESGTLLVTKKYNPTELGTNDLSAGKLNFGKAYMGLASYKASGVSEKSGTLAIIKFKVKSVKATLIKLTNDQSMSDGINGTMAFDWDGKQLTGYDVIQAPSINGVVNTEKPSNTVKPSNTTKPTVKPSNTTKPSVKPSEDPTPVKGKINVAFSNNGSAASSNQIYAIFKLTNPGSQDIDLSKITIKYFYTPDDDKDLVFYTDYVSQGTATATFKKDGNKSYVEIKLSSGTLSPAGAQWPKVAEATVQVRMAKADWTNLDQSNDYSYTGAMSQFSDNMKIAVYESGTLVYGSEVGGGSNPTEKPPVSPTKKPPVSPTNPKVTTGPTNGPTKGEFNLVLDKTAVEVGEIVKATLSISEIAKFSGYQASIKYDPTLLKPVLADGSDLDEGTAPDSGELLSTKKYNPTELAANDLDKGILNFGKSYMSLTSYKAAGAAETEGTLAVVYFKALKESKAKLELTNAASMSDGINGTMMFDWDGAQIKGYKVNPTSVTVSVEGKIIKKGSVEVVLNKTSVKVGEVVTATINIDDITNFSGYQAAFKYDPTLLKPVLADGSDLEETVTPDSGNLLTTKKYNPTELASNDLKAGILNFGKSYMSLASYKAANAPETKGSVAVVSFKALKKSSSVSIKLANSVSMADGIEGTMMFDWDGAQVKGYEVIQAPTLKITDGTASTSKFTATFDKESVKVNEIIKMTISIDNIKNFSGYQAAFKYDPTLLKPILADGSDVEDGVAPDAGSLLTTKKYNPTELAANDLSKGIMNFGKSYMSLTSYKAANSPETTGSIAVVYFKALKLAKNVSVQFVNVESMANGIDGTMLFDWDGAQLSDYDVVQPESFVIGEGSGNSPTTSKPNDTPTPIPSASVSPSSTKNGIVSLSADKTTLKAGEKVVVTLSIKDVTNFSGYQAALKYDPTVLKAVLADDTEIDQGMAPDAGTLLNKKKFNPTELASNDISAGVLSFGKSYMSLASYKAAGAPETTGTLAAVTFVALKDTTTETTIKLQNSTSMAKGITGTMMFDWDGALLSEYAVSPSVITLGKKDLPSNSPTNTPTNTPTVKPANGKVSVKIDNEKGIKLGDIIKVTINVESIAGFAGYQANIKYNNQYLQAWDTFEDAAYENGTVPDYGTLLRKNYNPTDLAKNNVENGILNFGRSYMNLQSYKKVEAETTGSIAVISFKVIKDIPTEGIVPFTFVNGSSMAGGVDGTMLFNSDGDQVESTFYSVEQPGSIFGGSSTQFMYGDVDGNKKINSLDYAYMRQFIIEMIDEFPDKVNGKKAADLDGNNKINSTDYSYLMQFILEMIEEFPVEKIK